MIFGDLVGAAAAILFGGGQPAVTDEMARYEWLRLERDRLRANGWVDWTAVSPYEHERIWIWRPEWDGLPREAEPNKMDRQMNVWGLFWKPWRENDTPQRTRLITGC